MKTIQHLPALLSSAVIALATGSAAYAQEFTFSIHHFLSPKAVTQTALLEPWVQSVQDASDGRIAFEIFPAMALGGAPPELYSQVRDGVADLVWTVPGYTPGVFPRLEVFELPSVHAGNAEATNRAIQDMMADLAADFEDVHPILVHVHSGNALHLASETVESLEDFAGLKIRSPSRTGAWMVEALGAEPVGMPVPALPQALSKNTVDAGLIPFEVAIPLRLAELTKASVELHDGARFGTGVVWDEIEPVGIQIAKDAGNSVTALSADATAAFDAPFEAVAQRWVTEATEAGIDGTAGFTANAVARLFGGNVAGLPGYEDGVTMLVGVAALAMFPYCQLHGGHAAVDVFMNKAPAAANRAVSYLSAALSVLLALSMAVMLTFGMLEIRADRSPRHRRSQMEREMIGVYGLIALFVLIMLRIPVALAMIITGIVGSWVVSLTSPFLKFGPYLLQFKTALWNSVANYDLSVVPLFILMGFLAAETGLSRDLFQGLSALTRKIKGGVAMATILACAGFGAVSGSSIATASTMSRVALPQLRRLKYDEGLATGTLAAGGTLGILIPPSVALVIYAIVVEASILAMFQAAVVPGIIAVVFFLIVIRLRIARNPALAPDLAPMATSDVSYAIRRLIPVGAIFGAIILGLGLGLFTPTPAAAVGVFLILVYGVILRQFSDDLFHPILGGHTQRVFRTHWPACRSERLGRGIDDGPLHDPDRHACDLDHSGLFHGIAVHDPRDRSVLLAGADHTQRG